MQDVEQSVACTGSSNVGALLILALADYLQDGFDPYTDKLTIDEIEEDLGSSVPAQLLRGQEFESDSLRELGLTKNGAGGGQLSFNGSIPDSVDENGNIWEIKDTGVQYYTNQLRNFVKSGRVVNLVVGPATRVSGPLEKAIVKTGGEILVREAPGVFEPYG